MKSDTEPCFICGTPSSHGSKYVELLDPYSLPDLGLGFEVHQGTFRGYEAPWLRWFDQHGALLLTGAEKAEHEKARADRERARSDELVARLRALGHEI